MPESATHAGLVQALIAFAQQELGALANLSVRDDSVRPMRGERPPRIGGYVPDLYATNVPTTVTLIGEAKTRPDLETQHSAAQIAAFLEYLSHTPNGIFVLGVPVTAVATARRIVAQLQAPFLDAQTRAVVIDGATASR